MDSTNQMIMGGMGNNVSIEQGDSFMENTSASTLGTVLGSPAASQYVYRKPKPYVRGEKKIYRNDPCPCGSGKKYKHCCMNKETSMED